MKKTTTAERLKEIMENRNLRQVDILEKCSPYCEKYGVSLKKNALSEYVNGKTEPGQSKLLILGMALNVNEAWLMGYDVPMERDTATDKKQSSFKSQQIIDENNFVILSPERKDEMSLLNKYRLLDSHGKKVVTLVLDEEYARCTEESDEPTIQIKHSVYKVSAGTGFELYEGDDWEKISVPNTPEAQRADYALTIQGNSMEPVYYNGDIILVKEQDDVDEGEIGIFVLNGDGYIKKKGIGCLISLNEKYEDIKISQYDTFECKGKVIGRV